ncbi:hypothetical protein NEMIN01_0409 [Nematocida minor]|uniref:uncharacterized protein n=1 Tax=Nematocida minor TaxID=1912983 RepID=UPI00221FC5B1|nr:uncharacterized protein NEMIN01_0409 [Nematocida minor]KAI5189243.1 hypothetical protein NEMIN01_0409 [Nematocida minor]
MELKQKIRKIRVLGTTILFCLLKAGCIVQLNDIKTVHEYWTTKIYYIEEEVNIRSNFFKKIYPLDSSMLSLEAGDPLDLKKEIRIGNKNLSKIKSALKQLKKCTDTIVKIVDSLVPVIADDKLNSVKNSKYLSKIKDKLVKLDRVLLEAFKSNTLLIEEINRFDAHMVGVIEEYIKKKCKSDRMSKLFLFRLAKNKKIMPASIILSLFNTDLFLKEKIYFCGVKNEDGTRIKIYSFHKNSIANYVSYMRKNVPEHRQYLLELADTCNFSTYHRLHRSKNNRDIMNIYLNLVETDQLDIEIGQYIDIAPVQIMKIIMIEHLLEGCLLNCKNNALFFKVGRIIERIFIKKCEIDTDIIRSAVVAREKQNKILSLYLFFGKATIMTHQMLVQNLKTFVKRTILLFQE